MTSLLQILLLHNTRITTTRMVPKVTVKIISFPKKMVIDTNQVKTQMVDQIKDIKIIILNVHNVSYVESSVTLSYVVTIGLILIFKDSLPPIIVIPSINLATITPPKCKPCLHPFPPQMMKPGSLTLGLRIISLQDFGALLNV